MKAKIIRINSNEKQSIGNLIFLEDGKVLKVLPTLELGWHDNKRNISCIPEGNYKVKRRYSAKYEHHFHVTDVKGRSLILLHKGNYHKDIRGCVLVGKEFRDINKDGYIDVRSSANAVDELMRFAPKEFDLEIINAYKDEK